MSSSQPVLQSEFHRETKQNRQQQQKVRTKRERNPEITGLDTDLGSGQGLFEVTAETKAAKGRAKGAASKLKSRTSKKTIKE